MPAALGMFWLMIVAGGVAGYVGPSMYIDRRIKARTLQHRSGFPDFMDLLVVCADSGLSMEASLERVGREIGSAALIADGYHARTDGLTSLAVVAGAVGVWLGFPLADPIVGVLISLAIFALVWQSAKVIVMRMLDGVETHISSEIAHAAGHVRSVQEVSDVRARWVGHRLHAELSVTVAGEFSVLQGHEIAKEVRHQLLHHLPHLGGVTVQSIPTVRVASSTTASGSMPTTDCLCTPTTDPRGLCRGSWGPLPCSCARRRLRP
jgi:hypothetical protein